ncbi:anti-sigma factor [Microlunatus sp. GCM10028923]|uniref:anti-sigma factor n=1 Tax=Microlunatus sp. GCM10028923 TaxID=3273400 RepID=UPI00360C9619
MTTPTEDDTPPARPPARPARELEAPDLDAPQLATRPEAATPGLRPNRNGRRTWLVPLLTLLLGLAVGAGLGLGWGRWWQPQPTVISSAALQPTADWPTASGSVTVEVTPQGERYVIAQIATPPPRDGYRQLWLVSKDGQGYYPLGAMVGDERRFPLPPGVDLSAFPTVEVSYQLVNGHPGPSGDTMLRGTLA